MYFWLFSIISIIIKKRQSIMALLSVIQHQKIMLKPKQAIPSNLPIKSKSPYARQFQDFQKRLQKKVVTKFPTIPLKSRKISLLQNLKEENDYLQLAKRIINNKQKLNFCEDKENLFQEMQKDSSDLTCMKNKIGKLRNRLSHQSQPQNIDIMENASQQISQMGASKGLREIVSNNRSRALSNVPILSQKQQSQSVNFLLYKKCKRDVSSRQKANE